MHSDRSRLTRCWRRVGKEKLFPPPSILSFGTVGPRLWNLHERRPLRNTSPSLPPPRVSAHDSIYFRYGLCTLALLLVFTKRFRQVYTIRQVGGGRRLGNGTGPACLACVQRPWNINRARYVYLGINTYLLDVCPLLLGDINLRESVHDNFARNRLLIVDTMSIRRFWNLWKIFLFVNYDFVVEPSE